MRTKYPILLVHGMGFRDRKRINYWGRIPKALEQQGNQIFYGHQDANGSIEDNALVIRDRILQIITETGAEKINVICHSKGGLDTRYAVCHYGLEDKIASITTIQTPHNGSKTMDLLMKIPDIIVKIIAKLTDLWLGLLGDRKPNTYRLFHSLTTKEAAKFNSENIISPHIYCQSYAFVMKNAFSDIFFLITYPFVYLIEGQNDGLLTPDAVKWGNFRGIVESNSNRGISHCDEVDMRRWRLNKKSGDGVTDIVDFYLTMADELSKKDF